MPGKSPFTGIGSGKKQVTGDGAIGHFRENTGPSPKGEKQTSMGPSAQSGKNTKGLPETWKP